MRPLLALAAIAAAMGLCAAAAGAAIAPGGNVVIDVYPEPYLRESDDKGR
ncbi:MAG TPA: hypothetical protein VFY04_05725 [Solirubrobacterales bacterium]|nr:hypothetical protein [Solirubrobacterales bacterium]